MTDYTQFEGTVSKHKLRITDVPQHYTTLGYLDPTVEGFDGLLGDNIVFTLEGSGETIRNEGIALMTTLFKQKAAADLVIAQTKADVYADVEYAINHFTIDTNTL